MIKNPPANAGDARDTSSIPGSGRSSGQVSLVGCSSQSCRGGNAVEQLSRCMCTQDQVLHALCMLPESSQAPQERGGSLLVLVDETTEASDDCDVPRGTARSQGKICLPPNLVFITPCGNNFCPCKYLQ